MTRSAVREVSRGSFYLGLEQLTIMTGGTIYAMIVLRLLGPATYGILSLGQAAVGLAAVLTTNIESYLERFVAEFDAGGKGGILRPLVRRIVTTKMLLAVPVSILVVLASGLIARAYHCAELKRLLPFLAPLIVLEGASWLLRVTLFGLQRFKVIWIVALANNVIKILIIIGLWVMHEGVVAVVAGLVAIQILTVIGQAILVLHYLPATSRPEADVPTQRMIWKYVLPLYGARALFLSGQHLNRLVLGWLLLPARPVEVGIASFALTTLERFIALAGAVPQSLLPTLSRLHGENRHNSIEKVVTEGHRLVAALSVLMMAGILCLARELVLVIGGPEYVPAILAMQILALVPLFRTNQQPLTMAFYTYEKTWTVFWLAGVKFAVEPILYPILIPKFGVTGVALSSLVSSAVVFGPTAAVADRMFPVTAGLRRSATLRAWAIGAAIAVAVGILCHAPDPWPGFLVRVAIFLVGVLLILLIGRMIHGDDLRRLARETRRPSARRLLAATAGWLDHAQRAMEKVEARW